MKADELHLSRLEVDRVLLRAERDRLRKDLDFSERAKQKTVIRHGEANAILEKLCRCWTVRLFCRALRKEAMNHVGQR